MYREMDQKMERGKCCERNKSVLEVQRRERLCLVGEPG